MIALSSHTRVAFIAVAKAKASEQGYSHRIREQAYRLYRYQCYLIYTIQPPTSPRIASFSSFLLSCIVPPILAPEVCCYRRSLVPLSPPATFLLILSASASFLPASMPPQPAGSLVQPNINIYILLILCGLYRETSLVGTFFSSSSSLLSILLSML